MLVLRRLLLIFIAIKTRRTYDWLRYSSAYSSLSSLMSELARVFGQGNPGTDAIWQHSMIGYRERHDREAALWDRICVIIVWLRVVLFKFWGMHHSCLLHGD